MKLVRYGQVGMERPALIDREDRLRDLSSIIRDIDSVTLGSDAWRRLVSLQDPSILPDVGPAASVRLGPCVAGVRKLICLGLNERAHADEIRAGAAANPIMFIKASSSISGAQDPVIYPKVGQKLDYETELAIVIGKRCKYVEQRSAMEVVAGFCILNDMSDRHWQTDHYGNMTLVASAKSFDTFAPMGPYMVTPDEIDDPNALQIKLWVNDELRQDFNSNAYIYDVAQAVEFCSQFFTLEPGDVISMGSGPGNGFTWKRFLQVGDRIRASVEGLGSQEFSIVAEV